MQTIAVGNLYFLDSPFHFRPSTDEAATLEKRLSYLLGTVSARPAVVIRPPTWWDKFNTVTVLPALSKGKPAYTLHLNDRYGRVTEAAYPFMPHNPHTIPVSRLGKYIGSLDKEELDELLYAFEWIHDYRYQADPKKYPVPKCYEKVFEQDTPASWKKNHDARSNVDIYIDKDTMRARSENFPSLNGFPLGDALGSAIPTEVSAEIEEDVSYATTDNPLPDSVEAQVIEPVDSAPEDDGPFGIIQDEETEKAPVVPVEKDFPPSIFKVEDLRRVAGRFDLSDAYLNDDLSLRDPAYLNEEEIRRIRGNMTNSELDELFEYYRTFKPMDAYILGPRLPNEALQSITGFDRAKTATLKRLCNVMRDIDADDYAKRVEDAEVAQHLAESQIEAEKKAKRIAAKEDRATTKAEQNRLLEIVKPYLSTDKIMTMTDLETVKAFLALPMGRVKLAWTGMNFKDDYQYAKMFYKKGIQLYEKTLEGLTEEEITKLSRSELAQILKKMIDA